MTKLKFNPLILGGVQNLLQMRLMSTTSSYKSPNLESSLSSKEISKLKSFMLEIGKQLKEKKYNSKLDAPCKCTNDEVNNLITDWER